MALSESEVGGIIYRSWRENLPAAEAVDECQRLGAHHITENDVRQGYDDIERKLSSPFMQAFFVELEKSIVAKRPASTK